MEERQGVVLESLLQRLEGGLLVSQGAIMHYIKLQVESKGDVQSSDRIVK